MFWESVGDRFNEVDYLLVLPDSADYLEDVVCDQGGESFYLKEEVGAWWVERGYSEGDCWRGPDLAFQQEGAVGIGEVVDEEGGGCPLSVLAWFGCKDCCFLGFGDFRHRGEDLAFHGFMLIDELCSVVEGDGEELSSS